MYPCTYIVQLDPVIVWILCLVVLVELEIEQFTWITHVRHLSLCFSSQTHTHTSANRGKHFALPYVRYEICCCFCCALLKQYGNSPTDSETRVDSDGDEDVLSWIAFCDFRFCFFFRTGAGALSVAPKVICLLVNRIWMEESEAQQQSQQRSANATATQCQYTHTHTRRRRDHETYTEAHESC